MPNRSTREMALLSATLSAVAARERKTVPPYTEEARRILANFPDCGISEAELAEEMKRVFASAPANSCH